MKSFKRWKCLRLCLIFLALEIQQMITQVNGQFAGAVGNLCAALNNCNGHGRCNSATKTCTCFEGYGAPGEISSYKTPDCSQRVCPSGPSWTGLPIAANQGHQLAECSDAGICDRTSGVCKCFSGYEGYSCQRNTCPNACSGHGICVSMKEMAALTNAFPLSAATTYSGAASTTTWDEDRMYGCVCDSSWAVGLRSGERQSSQWFGPDCSRVRCPSGNDPMTAADETDCSGVTAAGGYGVGQSGNLCHVDCSNRGICDYSTGLCKCFQGFYGSNCGSLSPIQ